MNKSLNQVSEFHQTFEHPIGENPQAIEDLRIRQLRIKLLFEELAELAEAGDVHGTLYNLCAETVATQHASVDGDNVNKKEELDALCDIQYVLNGKILTSGLQETFDANFDRVHANNMNKAHRSSEHALETVALLNNKQGECTILERDGKFLVLNESGKLVKPHDHKKVELDLNLR